MRRIAASAVAAVTGGSAGIGKAICQDLLAQGYEVVSLARRALRHRPPEAAQHRGRPDGPRRHRRRPRARLAQRFEVTTRGAQRRRDPARAARRCEARRPRRAGRAAPGLRDPAGAGGAAGDAGAALRPRRAAVLARGGRPGHAHQLLGHQGRHARHGAHLGARARAPTASRSTWSRRGRSAPTCSTTWSQPAATRSARSPRRCRSGASARRPTWRAPCASLP